MPPRMGSEPVCICGTYGGEITDAYAELLGQAIGTRSAGGRVIVGGDLRKSTPALKQALILGILSTGCEVYDVGLLPTPALSFAKDRFWGDGSVMVTGSHRPLNENGFKITLGKFPATETDIEAFQEIVQHKGPFASGSGQLVVQNSLEPYASFLVARFVPVEPLRVVVNAGNGTMRWVAAPILLSLGYEVVECVYEPEDEPTPDPWLTENQAILAQTVLKNQAHLGIAYDGDGDQVVFATGKGQMLMPAQVLVLLARALLVHQSGSQVVYDASFAPFVANEIRKVGGNPVPLDIPADQLKQAFLERGAVLGGDSWGHYFFRSMGGDDALFATLVMLRFVGTSGVGLDALIADCG